MTRLQLPIIDYAVMQSLVKIIEKLFTLSFRLSLMIWAPLMVSSLTAMALREASWMLGPNGSSIGTIWYSRLCLISWRNSFTLSILSSVVSISSCRTFSVKMIITSYTKVKVLSISRWVMKLICISKDKITSTT